MPTIDNLYALSELFQLPIDAIVRGNRAPRIPDFAFEINVSCSRRLYVYYAKLNEKRAA